jgi:hypothetical protein
MRCAARSIDLFPAGEELALRLDFFGDEIDSVRRFDPADQRSTDKGRGRLHPDAGVRALLDEESIKRFRSRYREKFGATATRTRSTRRCRKGGGWPAWSIGCLCSRSGSRPCSTISARRSDRPRHADQAPPRAARRSPIITRTGSARWSRPIRAATARSSPTALYFSRTNGRRDRRAADPPRLPVPRAGERDERSISASSRARLRARARAAGQRL